MRKPVLLLVFALAACDDSGPQLDTCGTAYSWPDDVYGNTGLVLHAPKPAVTFVTFEDMEREWLDVAACAVPGVTTPGPRVEFRSFKQMGLGGAWGVYAASGSVYINTDEALVQRNCHSDRDTLRHEFTHYVLWVNGREWGHGSPAFTQCDTLGAKVCDGVACDSTP